jgi:hypothetical protein
MQLSFSHGLFKLSLVSILAAPSLACPSNGGESDSDTATATQGTTTQTQTTTDGTTTQTATTDGTTTQTATTDGTTNPTTTSPTTTDDTTTNGGGDGQFCQEACAGDADCTINGADAGFTCQDSRCTSDAGKCTTNEQCQATFSGWITDCQSDNDCPGQVCIDVGNPDAGKCATPPSDFIMCETLMQVEITAKSFADGSDVQVCANTSFECNADGFCENPCEANADCSMIPGHPQCNTGTGKCECASDDDCKNSGTAGFAVCNGGVCGCGADSDCAGMDNADKCFEGSCGCSVVDVCMGANAFDGTMKVCEGV